MVTWTWRLEYFASLRVSEGSNGPLGVSLWLLLHVGCSYRPQQAPVTTMMIEANPRRAICVYPSVTESVTVMAQREKTSSVDSHEEDHVLLTPLLKVCAWKTVLHPTWLLPPQLYCR